MSIKKRISATIIGTAFALGAVASVTDAFPGSPSVVADGHWGEPQPPSPGPGAPLTITDDGHWG